MLLDSIKMAWQNIIHNKLRSFLTMLGIVIGVASIIALITIVQSATKSISQQVASLGVNKVMLTILGTPFKQGLSQSDLSELAQLPNISGVSPSVSKQADIVYKGRTRENTSVQGRNEVYFKADSSLLKSGRAINVLDTASKNQVAILGSDIVKDLYYGFDPLGQELIINGTAFTVIGTLTSSNQFSLEANNDAVIIPFNTALRNLGVKEITSLDVYLTNTDLADETLVSMKEVLNPAFNYKENAFTIFNMNNMINAFQSMMGTMSLLLAGIAAISLVVGGIGIMNMTLVSVTERTTEIGLRKALGATPQQIQLQIIIESIFLSIFGGIIGFILGSLIAYAVSSLMAISFTLSFSTVALALGFSAAVGLAFGYMPARKASKLNPIDALRSF